MPTVQGAAGIYSDDFYEGAGAKSPDPVWTETDPNAVMVPTFEGASTSDAYHVLTLTNDNQDYYSDVDSWTAPYVVQTAGTFTTANFDVRVEVTSQPYTTNFDDCGILITYSGGYMVCGVYRSGSTSLAYCQTTGDTFTETGDLGTPSGLAPFELRIQRDTGNVFRAYYDIGGGFVQIGTDSTMTPGGITPTGSGMYVGSQANGGSPVNPAKFDWFFEESSAFYAYEDTGETGPAIARRVLVR